jgi:hypothetical protein
LAAATLCASQPLACASSDLLVSTT